MHWRRDRQKELNLAIQTGSNGSVTGATNTTDGFLVELSAEIVSAYVGHNALSVTDLPKLIAEVHNALKSLQGGTQPVAPTELKPAVPVRKSIAPDYLICLEDGKKFKSLKRHLRTHYDLSPEQYREKWGLAADYPMVAPNYSETRSRLAKDNGLGRKAK
jgi:predicted transcriptional regulator